MSKISAELDFKELEKELQKSIKEDEQYWKENDAKIRAVTQRVSTYEEFRDIVKASHLKPIEKSDISELNNCQRGCIWNSFVDDKTSPLNNMELDIENVLADLRTQEESLTELRYFRKFTIISSNEDRYKFLQKTGAEEIGKLFKKEIPIGVLGKFVEALLCFSPSVNDIIFVTQVLEALTKTKRFIITLEFLTREEKDCCSQLMKKLEDSFKDKQQDLAEQGVTEWTITTLRSSYKL